jgi:two-component system, NarL family, sensor histidine kinase UhpB
VGFPIEAAALPSFCAGCSYPRAEDALRRVNLALEEQARAIGQSLHDEAGQLLTAAHTALAAAAEGASTPLREHLDAVKRHLDAIEEQLRQVAYELRPRVLDDLGLVPAVRSLVDTVRLRGNVTVAFSARVTRALPATVETAVYRLLQEALTNVRRHSRATRLIVQLEERRGALVCRVSDNGIGFHAARRFGSGLGLRGIRDRMNALGADLSIRSVAGRGTELLAEIPLEDDDRARTYSAR